MNKGFASKAEERRINHRLSQLRCQNNVGLDLMEELPFRQTMKKAHSVLRMPKKSGSRP